MRSRPAMLPSPAQPACAKGVKDSSVSLVKFTAQAAAPDVSPASSEAAVTVWYDGACPLCAREIAWFRRLDRRSAIRFEDISQAEPSCPIDPGLLLSRFHAQEQGKPIVSGAAAFAAMWRAIPVLRPFGELARLPPLLGALEWLYVAFLRIRPRLQRLLS